MASKEDRGPSFLAGRPVQRADPLGLDSMLYPHYGEAHLQTKEAKQVRLHQLPDGSTCKCPDCLLEFTRLMIKLFPASYAARAFQFEPEGIVYVLDDNGDIVGTVHPSYFFKTPHWIRWVPCPQDPLILQEGDAVVRAAPKVHVRVASTREGREVLDVVGESLRKKIEAATVSELEELGLKGNWKVDVTLYKERRG